ncbi:hypothetical protein [Streptomyces sp. NRRL S-455]|uniref:hypothetical protein n=1 Tax=Streptomyces sp. NRRL S-455 TaxID=1463908 RepID=UPI0004C20D88|nr:hypothetical protein [Streptomyces sp. NRRL S-455]
MKLDRMDIVNAAETAEVWDDDYEIREAYSGRYMGSRTCLAVTLPSASKLTEFMVALAVQLTENDRADDALSLARMTRTDSMGTGIVAYWPGVELAG